MNNGKTDSREQAALNRKVAEMAFEYFDLMLQARDKQEKAARIKQSIFRIAGPGRYSRYTVSRVRQSVIHVSAYTRHGYRTLRQRTTRA